MWIYISIVHVNIFQEIKKTNKKKPQNKTKTFSSLVAGSLLHFCSFLSEETDCLPHVSGNTKFLFYFLSYLIAMFSGAVT